MPSPKSGTAGTLVKPTAPTDAKDAVDATGGSTQDVSNSGSKSGSAPSSVTVGAMGSASSSAGASSASSSAAAASDPPPPEHKPADNPDKTSWIELQLVYESNGLPVAGMPYQVTLPDGTTVASGSTDEQGGARVENIDPGSCQISFPTLDQEAWEDA